jgi:hypothetical protein
MTAGSQRFGSHQRNVDVTNFDVAPLGHRLFRWEPMSDAYAGHALHVATPGCETRWRRARSGLAQGG